MKLFLQKMQNFRALGLRPQTPVPLAAGGFAPKPPTSTNPHWPPATGGSAPKTPNSPPLRISGYAPEHASVGYSLELSV